MADSESFLQEVSDEVRRDQFYRFLKKYGWLLAILVIISIGASASYELVKNAEYGRAKKNGDVLSEALKEAESGNIEEIRALLSEDSKYLNASNDLVAITRLLYAEYLSRIDDKLREARSIFVKVYNSDNVSSELRELAKAKHMLLYSSGDDKKIKLIETLSSPDNFYRFLAQEQRVVSFVINGNLEDAHNQINILLENMEVSQSQKRRLIDIQSVIK